MMTPPQGSDQPNPWLQILPPFLFFIGVMYFMVIRPARTRQKKTQAMLQALKPGDRVVTTGGLLGTIVAVREDLVQIRIADNVRVDVTKAAVVGLQSDSEGPPSAG